MHKSNDDQFRKAYSSAMNFLSLRDHSRLELKKKLASRGYDEKITEQVIQSLVYSGYIKEDELASRYADIMLSKGYGKFRIRVKMQQKGLDGEDFEKAIGSDCWLENELNSAITAGSKKIRSIKDEDQSKIRIKLSRFLVSRGFDYDITREAVKIIMEENGFQRASDDLD